MKKETKEKYLYPMAIRATVVVAGVLVFFLIYRIDQVERELGRLIGILMPFIYGCVMAYLVRPVCSFLERHLLRCMEGRVQERLAGKLEG